MSVLIKQLRDALLDAYQDSEAIEALLMLIDRSGEAPIRTGDFDVYVLKVIVKAKAGGWLLDLFREALDDTPGNPRLQQAYQALQEIAQREPAPVDPYEAWVLRNGDFLVDRRALRQAVRDSLDNQFGKRVLIVVGPRYSGRTNCISFLGHLKDDEERSLIPIDLEHLARSGQLNVDAICTKIALLLGHQLPENTEQRARLSVFFADWLAGLLNNSGKECWVVFDHLDKALLPDTVKDFISNLVNASKLLTKRLRVVLLGLPADDPLLGRLQAEFTPEELGDVDDKAFAEFFAKLYDHLHRTRNLDYDDQQIAASVASVVRAREQGDRDLRFERQWSALRREVERLHRQQPATVGGRS